MSLVTVMPSGKTFEAPEGSTLLAAIVALDPGFITKCGGNAKCGKCHISVVEGRKGLSKVGKEENELLDTTPGMGSKSRFACQVKILGTENVTVAYVLD